MLDTFGQAANRTGGFASSYAIGAANQAQNYYMAQLADQIPALQQLAYEMYLNEGADNYNQLDAIRGMDNIMYNRFVDDLGQWNTDRNFNYGVLRDQIGDALQADDTRYDRWLDAIQLGLINPTAAGDNGSETLRTPVDETGRDGDVVPPSPTNDSGLADLERDLMRVEDSGNANTVPSRAAKLIQNYMEQGLITEATARRLLSQYGISA